MMTSSGSTPSCSKQALAQPLAALAGLPPVEDSRQRLAGDGQAPTRRAGRASRRWSITSGTPPARKTRTVGWSTGPLGRTLDQPRDLDVDVVPVVDGRPAQAGGEGDRGDVQQQVRRAAERGVDDHRVADGGVGEDVARGRARCVEPDAARRAERRAMSSQIGWPEGASAECGSDRPSASATTCDGGGGAEELAAAAGAGAGPAAELGGLLERELAVGEAGADGLDLAGVLALARAAASRRRGRGRRAGRCMPARAIIIAGRPLSQVATPSTPLRVRQRADQAAEDDGRVVAVGQAVHHAGRALGAAVARVGDHARRTATTPSRLQLLGRRLHQQADLPVAGVIAQRDRRAVGGRGGRPAC